VSYRYRYPGPSTAAPGRLCLATSGGSTPEGRAGHPHLLTGVVARPAPLAAGLDALAGIARRRFTDPRPVALADPIVVSDGTRLRFEALSACGGVYARLDLPALGIEHAAKGTTSVEVGAGVRDALGGLGDGPVRLQVGPGEGEPVEREAGLPPAWLDGFGLAQLSAAGMTVRATLDGAQTRRFLRTLPSTGTGVPGWVVPAGGGLELSTGPGRHGVCLAGPERLRVLQRLAPLATGLRVAGPEPGRDAIHGRPGAWLLDMDGARLTVMLSSGVRAGFAAERGVDVASGNDAARVSALLAWEPRIDPAGLAARAAMRAPQVEAALARLGRTGRTGYDIAEGAWFHRGLAFRPPTP
jgi:hypothetical protein